MGEAEPLHGNLIAKALGRWPDTLPGPPSYASENGRGNPGEGAERGSTGRKHCLCHYGSRDGRLRYLQVLQGETSRSTCLSVDPPAFPVSLPCSGLWLKVSSLGNSFRFCMWRTRGTAVRCSAVQQLLSGSARRGKPSQCCPSAVVGEFAILPAPL